MNLFRNILTTVLLTIMWAAPLRALTPAEEDALYNRIDSLYESGMSTYRSGDYSRSAALMQQAVTLQQQIAEDDDLLAMLTTLAY